MIIWATVTFVSKTLSYGDNVVLSRAVNLKLARLKLVTFMKLFHVCSHDLIVLPWTRFGKYGNEATNCMKTEIIWATIRVWRRGLLWSSLCSLLVQEVCCEVLNAFWVVKPCSFAEISTIR